VQDFVSGHTRALRKFKERKGIVDIVYRDKGLRGGRFEKIFKTRI
jgi:hypothetical protein